MKIILPTAVTDELIASDAVRLMFDPPGNVSPSDWHAWAEAAFDGCGYDVALVQRTVENGRLRLAVILGDLPDDPEDMETFRLQLPASPPASFIPPPTGPKVTITMGGVENWTPPVQLERPPAPPKGAASRPVRVYPGDHALIRNLAEKMGLGIADTIGRAVALLAATEKQIAR